MKRLIAVLLLIPTLLKAQTYVATFTAPYPEPYPAGGVQIRDLAMGGGIVATFGPVWRRGWDCDQPDGNKCHPCTGQGYYVPTPDGGPPGRQREDDSGDFANEPSPGVVAWLPSGWPGSGGGDPDSADIIFDQPVKYVSFWYSSSVDYNFWCAGGDSCGYGAFCTLDGPLKPFPGGTPKRVWFASLSPFQLLAKADLTQPGTRSEVGCVGDPLGSACSWTKVEFSSNTPFRELYFEIGALGPFFMDDLAVSTSATVSVSDPPLVPLRDGYYDLAGRRLSKPPSNGLYWRIENGRPRKLVRVI